MSLYELPKTNIPKIKLPRIDLLEIFKDRPGHFLLTIFISSVFGFLAGILTINYLHPAPIVNEKASIITEKAIDFPVAQKEKEATDFLVAQEEAVIGVVEGVSPAIVSVIATRYLPVISPWQEFFAPPEGHKREIERREVGWGSGFIISKDGLILTNRHVVSSDETLSHLYPSLRSGDARTDYTVVLNDGREFRAEVLARDRVLDLAILRIGVEEPLSVVELGDSVNLRLGQTVIAIGNVLGEFQNSVSVGVVSGLGRTVTAQGGGLVMTLENVIQTDAAINPGNSGGPLLNLRGQVIGINTAMVVGAENIGFAIPVNQAKEAIEEVKEYGRIRHPFLGVRWVLITRALAKGEKEDLSSLTTERMQREYDLPVSYGILLIRGRWGEPAIFSGSAAEKAGLRENDIILKFNQEKITPENSLARIIVRYNPGDRIALRILREGREKTIEVIFGERIE